MKRLFPITALLFTFLSSSAYSQNNQFYYDYKYKSDSLNRNLIDSELMVLDSFNNGSKFYSKQKANADSTRSAIIKAAIAKGSTNIMLGDIKDGKISDKVLKSYPSYSTKLLTKISSQPLVLENSKKIDWKILPEKNKIFNYNVQKATTTLYGRKWVAWFASDIPVQDGPSLFYGLPGLILKIEDTLGDHAFTLLSTKNLPSEAILDDKIRNNQIVVSEEKFNKLWREYKQDPTKDMRAKKSEYATGNMTVTTSMSFGGKTYSEVEMIKAIDKERRDDIVKYNNFMFLNLYR